MAKLHVYDHFLSIFLINFFNILAKTIKYKESFEQQIPENHLSNLSQIWELSLVCYSLCNLKQNNFILPLQPPQASNCRKQAWTNKCPIPLSSTSTTKSPTSHTSKWVCSVDPPCRIKLYECVEDTNNYSVFNKSPRPGIVFSDYFRTWATILIPYFIFFPLQLVLWMWYQNIKKGKKVSKSLQVQWYLPISLLHQAYGFPGLPVQNVMDDKNRLMKRYSWHTVIDAYL